MNLNARIRVAVLTALIMSSGLLFLQCSPSSTGDPLGAGGGSGGFLPSDEDAATGTGGRIVGDAPIVNLDVNPVWYGESDVRREPDLPTTPTIDSNCGVSNNETVREPAEVLLVLDRSLSMDFSISDVCYCDPALVTGGVRLCKDLTNCMSRWNAIKPALKTTLATSNYVHWGLKMFSSSTTQNCIVSSTMEVPISEDAPAAIDEQIETAKLSLSTPTALGLQAATEYLKSMGTSSKKFILLATDGEPNCGGNPPNLYNEDVPGASAAAAAALEAGFPVYVIGIGPEVGNLTQLAQAGGTTDYYPATSPEQLAEALSAISKVVGSCVYQVAGEPPDPENVAVYVNKQQIAKSDDEGWKYGDTKTDIVLTGSYCESIMAGNETKVQILFGCPGADPFPPFVP